jgi:hypothetical protein
MDLNPSGSSKTSADGGLRSSLVHRGRPGTRGGARGFSGVATCEAPLLLEALTALTLASATQAEAPAPSAPTSSPIELFLIAIRSRCPPVEPKVRAASPAALLRLETGFRSQLSAPDRTRLDQARRGGDHCPAGSAVGHDANCQSNADLSAILHSDLTGAFAEYVCAKETAADAPR